MKKAGSAILSSFVAVLFAACAANPAQTSAASPLQSAASPPPASSAAQSAAPSAPSYYGRTASLPEGEYTPAAAEDTGALAHAWVHYLDPAAEGIWLGAGSGAPQNPVLMVRFEQPEGFVQLGIGEFGTNEGLTYTGRAEYAGEGVFRARLFPMPPPEEGQAALPEGEPTVTVDLLAEWPAQNGLAVFTLVAAAGDDADFEKAFGPYLGLQLAYAAL